MSNNTPILVTGAAGNVGSVAFKFEPDNYQSGFAKPVAGFNHEILLVPYYEIAEEILERTLKEEKLSRFRPGIG
jgi:hypothetical protein